MQQIYRKTPMLKCDFNKVTAIWNSRHWHIGISNGIDVGIGIGIVKNLFGFAKSLFMVFQVLYEENIHGEVADLPKSFRRCLEQLFCRKTVSTWF